MTHTLLVSRHAASPTRREISNALRGPTQRYAAVAAPAENCRTVRIDRALGHEHRTDGFSTEVVMSAQLAGSCAIHNLATSLSGNPRGRSPLLLFLVIS